MMGKRTRFIGMLLAVCMATGMTACGTKNSENENEKQEVKQETQKEEKKDGTRTIVDGMDREVEIPEEVDSIICLNVTSLRYTCYMQAEDLVVGVEDYEQKQSITRPYNYINYDKFKDLPIVGNNGEHYIEEIITADPDVIMMSSLGNCDADDVQKKTGIPVVVIPGSDQMMDENVYETFKIMGEVYDKEDRAEELISYLEDVKKDLDSRTKELPEEEKETVYVGGVSFKGAHGFEGTEANYAPFSAIYAKNLANETDQKGAFNIDLEQVLAWNPEVLFVDFNGMELINQHYQENPDFYKQLKAVQEGKVYSQISFRSSATNLDMALADTYYAGTVLYPEKFADVDPAEKADEIFEKLLGEKFYDTLKENGYEFRQVQIGE